MELNPHSDSYTAALEHVKQLRERAQKLAAELAWHAQIDPSALQDAHRGSQLRELEVHQATTALLSDLDRLKDMQRNIISQKGTLLNPRNWFSKEQASLRRKSRQLQEKIDLVTKEKMSLDAELNSIGIKLAAITRDIERYSECDVPRIQRELSRTEAMLVKADADVETIGAMKKLVDDALAPLLRELSALESGKRSAEERLIAAQSYDDKLSSAPNSYERAMIHRECEQRLGAGRPGALMVQLRKEIRQIEYEHSKLLRRVQDVAAKAGRNIASIIIDGNNLCYEAGAFIGLSALRALLPVLTTRYRVVVVFDAAIRQMLRGDDAEIRRQLNSSAAVHIVATKEAADETVLELASSDERTFVISNDRYGDYPDKSAVRSMRILRHEIVDGHIFVHDLKISIAFR